LCVLALAFHSLLQIKIGEPKEGTRSSEQAAPAPDVDGATEEETSEKIDVVVVSSSGQQVTESPQEAVHPTPFVVTPLESTTTGEEAQSASVKVSGEDDPEASAPSTVRHFSLLLSYFHSVITVGGPPPPPRGGLIFNYYNLF